MSCREQVALVIVRLQNNYWIGLSNNNYVVKIFIISRRFFGCWRNVKQTGCIGYKIYERHFIYIKNDFKFPVRLPTTNKVLHLPISNDLSDWVQGRYIKHLRLSAYSSYYTVDSMNLKHVKEKLKKLRDIRVRRNFFKSHKGNRLISTSVDGSKLY